MRRPKLVVLVTIAIALGIIVGAWLAASGDDGQIGVRPRNVRVVDGSGSDPDVSTTREIERIRPERTQALPEPEAPAEAATVDEVPVDEDLADEDPVEARLRELEAIADEAEAAGNPTLAAGHRARIERLRRQAGR